MTPSDQFRSTALEDEDSLYTTFSDSRFMARIGDSLRSFYADVASGTLPDDLVELANRIDERRRSQGREG